jgi:hypothetical protein
MGSKSQNLAFWGEKDPQNLIIQKHRFEVEMWDYWFIWQNYPDSPYSVWCRKN